jgi:predicted lipid-binding transport protein (Tim44 family)
MPKVHSFEDKLTPELLAEFNVLINELWIHAEADSTDLGALNAKVEGMWPKEQGEQYYTRINGKLYEVSGKLVEEEPHKPECNHDFESDGGQCKHCHKTVFELNNP